MNYLKKIGISTGISFVLFLIFSFLLTLLEYTGIISSNVLKVVFSIIIFLSFLIGGILFGKKSLQRGWWEGIKLSILNIFIVILLSLLFTKVSLNSTILYSIMFLATTIGSIIGVNLKKTQN